MKTPLLTLLFLCFFSLAEPATLKDRLSKARPGDYIVTAQGSNYSLLMIRDIKGPELLLEEITIPQKIVELDKVSWENWVEKKAPGALSWIALSINLEKGTLDQCYSYFQSQWLFIEKSDHLFTQLLTLNLRPTRTKDRKRIGPAPPAGETDRRKLWKPQIVREGKKVKKAKFDVLRTQWPSDKSRLAGCIFELYLDAGTPDFPFPYWMEVQSPHYTFKVRVVDSGRGITSPMRPLL
ncbi:MAG: hypothetical protein KR126chlam1_00589 [Chlamydiae bacterium]|nr:hypothetical protein [Chlamydiota bacterium]